MNNYSTSGEHFQDRLLDIALFSDVIFTVVQISDNFGGFPSIRTFSGKTLLQPSLLKQQNFADFAACNNDDISAKPNVFVDYDFFDFDPFVLFDFVEICVIDAAKVRYENIVFDFYSFICIDVCALIDKNIIPDFDFGTFICCYLDFELFVCCSEIVADFNFSAVIHNRYSSHVREFSDFNLLYAEKNQRVYEIDKLFKHKKIFFVFSKKILS
jgi:hypothetical protein